MVLVEIDSVFDRAYWSSQPPYVASVQTVAGAGQRHTAAQSLAQKGFIDVQIWV
jgi:hypothetical protein